ncbi:MAG: hypothetical protein HY093_04735 [Candidatus Liptonbacteria bacterium]|nr:hypothetical protein [Candidatus Liptonbacteria bacterium]
MKYDVYFHNDFDGRVSSAVFLEYLRSRGDSVANYFAVDHYARSNWDRMVKRSKNPVVIFDFYYHPKAAFFFDHHLSTFIRPDWEKKFKRTKYLNLNFKYESCCHLVFDVLVKKFGYRPSRYIKDLVKWADIVDAAKYKSAKDTIELNAPALQIDSYLDQKSQKGDPVRWVIEELSRKDLVKVAKDRRVMAVVKNVLAKIKESLEYHRKNLQIFDKVCFIDLSLGEVERVRFAPHFLVPSLSYIVTLLKSGKVFRVAVGANPWRPKSHKHDLRKLVRERYGFKAGGHARAAGITGIKNKREAMRIVHELIKVLNG